MEIVRCAYRLRCELGGCKEFARYTVKFANAGIRSALHICGECLNALAGCLEKLAAEENAAGAAENAADCAEGVLALRSGHGDGVHADGKRQAFAAPTGHIVSALRPQDLTCPPLLPELSSDMPSPEPGLSVLSGLTEEKAEAVKEAEGRAAVNICGDNKTVRGKGRKGMRKKGGGYGASG